MLAILMPAAGASKRMMGRDKLTEFVDGVPLLARQVARALATGSPVFVTMRTDRPARMDALSGLACPKLTCVPVDAPDAGLSASLRAGVQALPNTVDRLMILLPDLPDIETDDLDGMIRAHDAYPQAVLRGCAENGTPGHPVIFPRAWFDRLRTLNGDIGAGALLKQAEPRLHALIGMRALTDLDTPEAWKAWRSQNGQ
ncbi:nucleotidyltransferase family protein [Roseovarius aestuarii]|nr:nucleotidyltransferase family protein [Roseovarius aestuarii]